MEVEQSYETFRRARDTIKRMPSPRKFEGRQGRYGERHKYIVSGKAEIRTESIIPTVVPALCIE